MTYQTELETIQQPLSAELYVISYGGQSQYLTSHTENVLFWGVLFLARPLRRTGFSIEKAMKTVDVTVSVPVAVAFGEYIATTPYANTLVTIAKVFLSDPDNLGATIFTGMVYNVSVKNGVASVLCKSHNGLLSRKTPRLFYQTNCNWALFSANCGVLRETHVFNATVGSASDNDLVIPRLTNAQPHQYQGGTITFGQEQRLITYHNGTTITLLVQFANITAGSAIKLYPGCNGSPAACASFNNSANFMGMPHIPTRNALLWGFR